MFSVLHVENNRFYHEIVKNIIKDEELQYIPVKSPEEAFRILESTKINLIITGLIFEVEAGEQFVKKLNMSKYKNLPILILSSTDDEDIKKKMFELGAAEFINKNFIADKLKLHINKYISRDYTIEKDINLDELTKLFNRKYVFKRLEEEVKRHRRYKERLSLAIFNLDRFKRINTLYGHEFGDQIIVKISDILKSQIRGTDILGRYDDEMFILILTETDQEGSIILCDKLRRIIEDTDFGEEEITITVSIGIAQANNEEPIQLFNKVNELMLKAKDYGGNRIESYLN